jgi:hypothetical protein
MMTVPLQSETAGVDALVDESLVGAPPVSPDALGDLVTAIGRTPWLRATSIGSGTTRSLASRCRFTLTDHKSTTRCSRMGQ